MIKKNYEKPSVKVERYAPNQNVSACVQSPVTVYCVIGGQETTVFSTGTDGCSEATSTYYYVTYTDGNTYVVWQAFSTESDNDTATLLGNLLAYIGLSDVGGMWHYAEYTGTVSYGNSN